jgi:hypothetical protein
VFVAASAAIVVNRLVSEPLDSAAGLALVGLGVPAYLLWARRAASKPQLQPAAMSHDGR